MEKLFADCNISDFNERLKSLIEIEARDSFETHLRQVLQSKNEQKIIGHIGSNNSSFKIWYHQQGTNGLTGVFYPVLEGKLKPIIKGTEINLKSKQNIIGRIILLLVTSLLVYGITTSIIIQDDNSTKFLLRRVIVGLILFGILNAVPIAVHLKMSNMLKRYLIEKLSLTPIK